MTGRRRSSLPRGITNADAKALLASCDRRSAIGRRDYAVLITLLRLGLRRSEVAALGSMTSTGGPASWSCAARAPARTGCRCPRRWVRRSRRICSAGGRQTERREVFLRARAPLGPIAAGTVSSTVRRACRRAGIAEVGAHRLRHTVACEMVAAGVPLVQIAQVLRHHSLQSTAVYARVDVEQLRLLAAPWPTAGVRP